MCMAIVSLGCRMISEGIVMLTGGSMFKSGWLAGMFWVNMGTVYASTAGVTVIVRLIVLSLLSTNWVGVSNILCGPVRKSLPR